VLFCPGLDLSGETVKRAHAADDQQAVLLLDAMRRCVDSYLAGHPLDDPVISPLTADLTGLPPLLIQSATGDYQRPDAQLLSDRARSHGVDAKLELYPVDTHVFHVFWSFLPEAASALEAAGAFVRDVGAAEPASQA
jgi:monoterpene epsilon-lactone hydrolase